MGSIEEKAFFGFFALQTPKLVCAFRFFFPAEVDTRDLWSAALFPERK